MTDVLDQFNTVCDCFFQRDISDSPASSDKLSGIISCDVKTGNVLTTVALEVGKEYSGHSDPIIMIRPQLVNDDMNVSSIISFFTGESYSFPRWCEFLDISIRELQLKFHCGHLALIASAELADSKVAYPFPGALFKITLCAEFIPASTLKVCILASVEDPNDPNQMVFISYCKGDDWAPKRRNLDQNEPPSKLPPLPISLIPVFAPDLCNIKGKANELINILDQAINAASSAGYQLVSTLQALVSIGASVAELSESLIRNNTSLTLLQICNLLIPINGLNTTEPGFLGDILRGAEAATTDAPNEDQLAELMANGVCDIKTLSNALILAKQTGSATLTNKERDEIVKECQHAAERVLKTSKTASGLVEEANNILGTDTVNSLKSGNAPITQESVEEAIKSQLKDGLVNGISDSVVGTDVAAEAAEVAVEATEGSEVIGAVTEMAEALLVFLL
ncbi:hypothetical protein [Vibrio owensii]|uniref:Uncharacterized protein n=1 Tax=Vibrio owensii CAIM 1854 = LMG 25443 TaxID=1229493 RepID=A0A0C1ZE35_9VIBR|nr:hypothetical protein [Vibrio owensii]KIF54304.1 hypothetical protein H735_04460 [Vibrio owensii CAIM 1854 = LMG 25443]